MEYRLHEPNNGLGVDLEVTARGKTFACNIPPEGNVSDLMVFLESLKAVESGSTYHYRGKNGMNVTRDYS